MSTTYKTELGDTFSSISRKTTGTDTNAAAIARANPGVFEPIPEGKTLQIPGAFGAASAFKEKNLDIIIDNTRLGTFRDITISCAVDASRKMQLTAPNDTEVQSIINPLQLNSVEVGYNGESLLTGFSRSPVLSSDVDSKVLSLEVSSRSSILETSIFPVSAFPLEFVDYDLEQIVSETVDFFGVDYSFINPPGPRFDKVNVSQNQPVLPWLSGLAQQRGFVLSDDQFGQLLIWDAVGPDEPVVTIDADNRPDIEVTSVFTDEQYYSTVICLLRSKRGNKKTAYAVDNPFYVGPPRPYTYEVQDLSQGEMEACCLSAVGRMFVNAFTVKVTYPSWTYIGTDKKETVFSPGETIRIKSSKDYIPVFWDMLIKNVTLYKDSETETSTMELCLNTFNNVPVGLPWL